MSVKAFSIVVLLAVVALLPAGLVSSAGEPELPEKGVPAAAEPRPPDYLLGPEVLISEHATMPQTERYAPDVAANWVRGENLVVWHNKWPGPHRDIYARRVANDGRLLSWFAITAGPEDRMNPSVAFNAADAEYLVVFMKDVSGNHTTYEIWGRIIAWNNSYQKPEFQISGWPGRTMWTPRVVWNHNRNEYLVVWNAFDTTTGLPTDISSALIRGDGQIIDGSNVTTSTFPHQADLAYGWATDTYLVVFVRSYSQAATGNDIYGLLLEVRRPVNDVQVVNPPGLITIYSGTKEQNGPRVTTDGNGDYMVVWESEHQPGDNDIHGRKVDKNGTPVGGSFLISNWPQDETTPAIAASFNTNPEYVAVWQRTEPTGEVLAARRWGGGLPTRWFDVIGGEFWEAVNPVVAYNEPHYWFAWEGDSTSNPTIVRQIYGRRWTPNAVLLPLAVRRFK
jgi:hypothetical protein